MAGKKKRRENSHLDGKTKKTIWHAISTDYRRRGKKKLRKGGCRRRKKKKKGEEQDSSRKGKGLYVCGNRGRGKKVEQRDG